MTPQADTVTRKAKRTSKAGVRSAGGRERQPEAGTGKTAKKGLTPSDKAYSFILDKILSRQWPVKCKIMTEPELCERLDVSRVAVREAVERLSGLGLLEKKQGSGTFVTEPHIDSAFRSVFPMLLTNERDIRQVMEFRRHFEYGNVLLFMLYGESGDLRALEANYREMIELHATDPEKAWLLDFDFHHLIALGTKNQFIIKISDILTELMRGNQAVGWYFAATHGNATVYHNEIIRAIKNGDGEVAAMLMRRHIDIAIECLDKPWLATKA